MSSGVQKIATFRCFVACILTFFHPNMCIYSSIESILLVLQFFNLGDGEMVWAVHQSLSLNSPNQLEKSECGGEAEVQWLNSATVTCQHF